MNKLIISSYCIFIIAIFSMPAAIANESGEKEAIENNIKVNAKCHVALIDGSDSIIFYRIHSDKFHKLEGKIVGKKVLTQKSPEKIKIYRAFECVLDKDDFTQSNSKLLDKKTER